MKCPSCGEKLDDGVRICPECGRDVTLPIKTEMSAPAPVAAQFAAASEGEQVEKKSVSRPRKRKKWVCVLLAALALALLAGAVAAYLRYLAGSKYPMMTAGSVLLTGDATRVVYDDMAHSMFLPDSEPVSFLRASMDGTRYLLITARQSGGAAVDVFENGGLTRVTGSAAVEDIAFAAEADTLIWFSTYDGDAECGTLQLLHNGEETELAQNAAHPCLSPDGMTAAYSTVDADGTMRLRIATSGTDTGIVIENARPVAVSDSAQYLYYLQTDARTGALGLHARVSGQDTLLGLLDTASVRYYANRSLSELMYYADGKTYVSVHGAAGIKIANVLLFPMTPPSAQSATQSAPEGTFMRLGAETLSDGVYRGTNLLYYVDKAFAGTRISSDMTAAALSDDGRKLAYLANGSLYLTKPAADARQKAKILAEGDVASFAMRDDGKSISYILTGGSLLQTNDGGKNVAHLADGVASAIYAPQTDTVYWIQDLHEKHGTLMMLDDMGAHAVEGGQRAFAFCLTCAGLFVQTDSINGAYGIYTLREGALAFIAPGVKNMQF